MRIEHILQRVRPGRAIQGIAAALLPFEPDGRIAVDAFQRRLQATYAAGLTNAVNMDTGYVNYLTLEERHQVLKWAREAVGPSAPLVAGAYIEGISGDVITQYRGEMDRIVAYGATPILFQSSRLHGLAASDKTAVYRETCRSFPAVLAFELSPVFAPN